MFAYRRRIRRSRGSATAEFAILLPLLTGVVLICIDFGRFAHTYIAVNNAARAGAYYASIHPVTQVTMPIWQTKIRERVEDELAANGWFDPSSLVMPAAEVIDEGSGNRRVRVEVTYPFQTLVSWPFLTSYNATWNLRRVAVMRMIR